MPPQQQKDEKTLIHQAQHQNSQALGALYELHVEAVYRFMFYRTGDEMVAEDLTAEVFTQMITALERYEDHGVPFKAWLFRIARARLADYWRKTKRHEKYQRILKREKIVQQSKRKPLDNHFEHENLEQAMSYLTAAEREVVLLRFVGDFSNADIATIIQSNANAVKSRMHRAMTKLRKVLQQQAAFHREASL